MQRRELSVCSCGHSPERLPAYVLSLLTPQSRLADKEAAESRAAALAADNHELATRLVEMKASEAQRINETNRICEQMVRAGDNGSRNVRLLGLGGLSGCHRMAVSDSVTWRRISQGASSEVLNTSAEEAGLHAHPKVTMRVRAQDSLP